MLTKKILNKIIIIFLAWRAILELVAFFASLFFKPINNFINPFSYWANFDGFHYLTIITKGYFGTGLIQAFFPGFPMLVKLFNSTLNEPVAWGLLISHTFALLSLLAFYYLIKLDFSKKIANLSLLLLLLFPASFFLISFYSESLFIFLSLFTFILARKQKFLLAALVAALASSTRLVGIFLVPALLIELWQQKKLNQKNLLMVSLGSLGLLGFMFYLKQVFGDPLYFFHVQSEFGAGRQESIILFPQVIWRYLKIFATARPFDWKFYTYVLEFISAVGGLVVLIYSYKKIRLSYLVFSIFALILPTLTGNFSSMSRYVLICFPIFIFLSLVLEKKSNLKILYLIISSILLIINTMLFIQGHWVA
jgi:Gpi18-like mannosyltransferase